MYFSGSLEHSPRLSDAYRKIGNRDGNINFKDGENDIGHREGEVRLKEDLAEAMRDTDQGGFFDVSLNLHCCIKLYLGVLSSFSVFFNVPQLF